MTVIFCILLVIAGFIMIWIYARIITLENIFKEESELYLLLVLLFLNIYLYIIKQNL